VVKVHPFGGSWVVEGFGVVHGREEGLESDGLRGGEQGHCRGEGRVVVVIEQVVLSRIRV
jgi:hypothetical protein